MPRIGPGGKRVRPQSRLTCPVKDIPLQVTTLGEGGGGNWPGRGRPTYTWVYSQGYVRVKGCFGSGDNW